jgi:cytochrome bd-type quinol oxidase subunit 2
MREAIWSRLGPVAGVLFFVLLMAGATIHGYPDIRPSDSQLAKWLANIDLNTFRLGVYIEALGILLFIPFVAWLYGRLRQGKKDSSWPAATMLVAGAGWVASTLLLMGAWAGLADQARKGLDIRVAQTIDSINQASYDLTAIVLGVTVLAAGVAIVHGGAMSRWVGWAAIIIGVIDVVTLPFGIDASPAGILGHLWLFAVAVFYTFRLTRTREFVAGPAQQSVATN